MLSKPLRCEKIIQFGEGGFLRGFVFLPCELIDKNGSTLKDCVLRYRKLWDLGDDFTNWVEQKNVFCNTLVDRIVTGYPREETIDIGYEDKMLNTSELFHLWVIEGPDWLTKEFPFDKRPQYFNYR